MELNEIIKPDSPSNLNGDHQWKDTCDLLKRLQEDFRGARRRLEQVNSNLAEKEALIDEHLQIASPPSSSYQTLRLEKYGIGDRLYCLGRSVLGGVARPATITLASQIEVRCLGRFEVRSSDGVIDRWHSAKARSVLQFLLVRSHQPTPKEVLIEALWPGSDWQSANNNLKAAIHSLRSNLSALTSPSNGTPVVLFSEGSYRLNPEISLSIDVDEFEKLRANGRRLEKERRTSEAMTEFEKAEELYRGDYLEDDPYEEWALLKRETLKDNYLIILSKLADYCLRTFNYEDCIAYSQKILTRDQCREDAYRNLMYCHYILNQRKRALRWYEICCKTIRIELDTAPERETIELGQRILNNLPGRE